MNWQPQALKQTIIARAKFYQDIRQFFNERQILEVDTPLMCHAAIQDPHLHPIPVQYRDFGHAEKTYYLQTSPEFAMKRMLAMNIGPIYQLCKAFRNGEQGKIHNPEFTILEWYRPSMDHFQLMDEVDDFLIKILGTEKSERITYRDLFLEKIKLNPFTANLNELENCAIHHKININLNHIQSNQHDQNLTTDDWLNLLLTHIIEPTLGFNTPTMVYDFPASQAALAKIRYDSVNSISVAERFEVYIQGMELANGYHELTDATIQLERFKNDAQTRKTLNHPEIPIDMFLVQALESGLPDCAGVALGIDRLLMLKLGIKNIEDVLAFPIDRA